MKKVYLFSALSALLLASCANDDLVVKPKEGDAPASIAFASRMGNISRSTTQLEDVMTNFGVWALKANAPGDLNDINLTTSDLVVMPNYKVEYFATSSYGSDWSYVLTTSKGEQYLKYWDGAKTYTYFFAYGPWKTSGVELGITGGEATMEFPEYTMTSDQTEAYIYAEAQCEKNADHIAAIATNPTDNPKKVPISFKRMFSQLQVAIYEDIPGYYVKMNSVIFADGETGDIVAIPADRTTEATPVWSRGEIVYKTTPVITYNGTNYATSNVKYTKSKTSNSNIYFALPSTNLWGANGYIADKNASGSFTAKTDASYSATVWNIIPVHGVDIKDGSATPVSLVDKNSGLQFVVNYTLYSKDTKEKIEVKDARVYVPATNNYWEDNTIYTYIFRITKNSSGTTVPGDGTNPKDDPIEPSPCLYPIIFDDVIIDELNESEKDFDITDLVMSQTSAVLFPEDPLELTVTSPSIPEPPTPVTWASSDPAVATVSDGTISIPNPLTKLGKTVISATYGTSIATCEVEVTLLIITNPTMSINEGDTNVQITGYRAAAGATLSWSSSDTSVATVADGEVTAVAAGTTTITITATKDGQTSTGNITLTVNAVP